MQAAGPLAGVPLGVAQLQPADGPAVAPQRALEGQAPQVVPEVLSPGMARSGLRALAGPVPQAYLELPEVPQVYPALGAALVSGRSAD